ncbi:MAG: FCD domain-containing protein [Devosia sp.]
MTAVARAAGCSQSTVSIILRQTPGYNISAETRRRVAEAAIALGYVSKGPSRVKRGGGVPLDAKDPVRPALRQTARVAHRRDVSNSFTEKVARALALEILAGRYEQEAALPSDQQLMSAFGVSRTVLREALKMLASKGLIKARARIGTRVRQRAEWHLFDPDVLIWQAEAGLDASFVRHLGEMRMVLEPEAAALAAIRRSPAELEVLYKCVQRMGTDGISAADFARADLDFHLAVAAAADNPFLRAVSTLIEVALVAALRRSWPGAEVGGVVRSARAHRAIAEAIESGDQDAARIAMRAVIIEGTDRAIEMPIELAAVPFAR